MYVFTKPSARAECSTSSISKQKSTDFDQEMYGQGLIDKEYHFCKYFKLGCPRVKKILFFSPEPGHHIY